MRRVEEVLSHPDFYQSEQSRIDQTLAKVTEIQQQLEKAYERWAELEALAEG